MYSIYIFCLCRFDPTPVHGPPLTGLRDHTDTHTHLTHHSRYKTPLDD